MNPEPIYLDNAATTPLDGRVLDAMMPYLTNEFGNAASRQHALGKRAEDAVQKSREQVAGLIGADPREIVFTSGATESNNLALKGVATARAYEHLPNQFVTVRTEHNAVLDPMATLEAQSGFTVTSLSVDRKGHINLEDLERALEQKPRLVSCMHVNNELGSIHPIREIGARCRAADVLFHTDASQSAGKLPIDVNEMAIDLLSLSAHKFYGPKGVGALYIRRRAPRVRCSPLFDGGGQEGDRRSGTLNVPGIVGLGAAAEICAQEMADEGSRLATLANRFEAEMNDRIPGVHPNAFSEQRLPSIINLFIEGIQAEALLARLSRVCASSSSACTSSRLQESHVLRAIGASDAVVSGSIRFSLGRFTTEQALSEAVTEIEAAVREERTSK